MVWAGRALCRKYGGFISNLRMLVKGGAGGMGLPRLGGAGGKGGDVWVVAKQDVTMKRVKEKGGNKRYSAGVGGNSSVRSLKGPSGSDYQIEAPVGISVTTDAGITIAELNKDGDRIRVARGGYGGNFTTDFLPSKGQRRIIRIDLKLIADVGLIGFPNAGKSSLLGSLSHAKPQVADYPFTTVKPELGKIMYPDFKQISVADLPGLIEGAHLNKGMGHNFLKHVERTKQLLFVVDVEGFKLSVKTPFRTAFEMVQLLMLELQLYKGELLDKPALLAVNKMDLPGAEEKFQELMEQLGNPQDHLHILPEELVPLRQIAFKHIIPISAQSGQGIEDLSRHIRRSIDEQAEKEIQEAAEIKLQDLQTTISPSVTDPTQTPPSWT